MDKDGKTNVEVDLKFKKGVLEMKVRQAVIVVLNMAIPKIYRRVTGR